MNLHNTALAERTASFEKMAESSAALKWAIIVPTFRERHNVEPLYQKIVEAMPPEGWEIIFVDDNSDDGTPETVEGLARRYSNIRLIRRFGRRGLSSAAIEGMMATVAPTLAVIDGDMQHDETILPQMLEAVSGGADIAIGTRYGGSGSTGDWSKKRVRISRFATMLTSGFDHNPVSDPMSGFIAIRRDLMIEIMPQLSIIGFKLLLDILLSSPRKLDIREFHYTFRSRVAGESKLDTAVSVEFLMLLVEKKVGRLIPTRFLMFMTVGCVGLVLHLTLLKALLVAALPFSMAQVIAVGLTIASNFFLNNLLTYSDKRLRGWAALRGLASFYLVCGAGALANVGTAMMVYNHDKQWWLAGIAGAAIGSVWNYAASSFFTWRKK